MDINPKTESKSTQTKSKTVTKLLIIDNACIMCHKSLSLLKYKKFIDVCRPHQLCIECIYRLHQNANYFSIISDALADIVYGYKKCIYECKDIECDGGCNGCCNEVFNKNYNCKIPLTSHDYFFLDPDYVIDNIYIGSVLSSTSLDKMKNFGLTHVIAVGKELREQFPNDFKYYKLNIIDSQTQKIDDLLDEVTNFIHESNNKSENKILVHCAAGVSRSASIVIAYLIRYKKMRFIKAHDFLEKCRPVIDPNAGFISQLNEYELRYVPETDSEPDSDSEQEPELETDTNSEIELL